MPNKKKNLPIPIFSEANLEVLSTKIGLDQKEIEQKQYEKDHILQLEEEIKSLSHAKEQIAHLKAFRDYLSGHCILKGNKITIIQCSSIRKSGECKFKECQTLKPWKSLFL